MAQRDATDYSDTNDVEVVDEDGNEVEPMQANDDGIATYSTSFGDFSFKILPQSGQSGLSWKVWVFMSGTQGPILQSDGGITSQQADEINLPEHLRERINEDLRYVQENMTLPEGFESATEKKSLNDLEAQMNGK